MGLEIPRLSPSIAKILLQKSPLHAWNAHRLLGGKGSKPSAAQIKGSAVDAIVFGGTVPDCSKAVLEEAQAIAGAVKDELDSRGFIHGIAQHRIEWTNETGADCSGVVDLVELESGRFWELKTCHDLSDYNITKQIEQYGYDVQYAAYTEGLQITKLGAFYGQFIFVETSAPYDVRFVSMTESMYKTGSGLWRKACAIWNECLTTDIWPGRGDLVADVSPYRKKQEAEDWLNQ